VNKEWWSFTSTKSFPYGKAVDLIEGTCRFDVNVSDMPRLTEFTVDL